MSGKFVFSIIAFVSSVLLSGVQGSVLGIDLGGEFMKISSVSPGKSFMIVENTATKRKTQSAISFYNNQRWFEIDAIQKKSRAFNSTFTFIQKYLGKSYDEGLIQANKEKYYDYYNFEKEEEKGTIQFAVNGFRIKEGEDLSFTVEELVGMYLKHARTLAEKQANTTIKDAVLTIPPYYRMRERFALYDAMQFAGLTPLAFIHENTAAALHYGIERKDENKNHTVIFYNLGSTSLKVSLVEYSMESSNEKSEKNKKYESFTVLADAWEENVGGLVFDMNLANWLADEFDNQPKRAGKKKIRDSPLAMSKLIKEANKAKEILSANKETSVYVEAPVDDQDLKATILRSKFEELNQAAFSLLTAPIQKVLDAAGKTISEIDAFEVLGGAVRVPKVQQILQEFVGKNVDVGAHMNGDEAMAMGTSFLAASMSASFKTRPIFMNDGLNYPIYATIRTLGFDDENDDETEGKDETTEKFEKNTTLFPARQKLGSKKALSFTHDKDIKVILFTKNDNGDEEIFTTFHVTKVTAFAKKRNENTTSPKIHLTFKLNNLGFVELIKSEASMEETKLVEETSLPKKNKKNKTKSSTDQEADTIVEGDDASSTKEESTSNEDSQNGDSERKYKKKTISHNKELNINRHVPSHMQFSVAKIKKALKGLRKIEEFEDLRRRTSEAKNKLESFVYRSQELVSDDAWQAFATEEELDSIRSMAMENDDWLYSDDAKNAELKDFEERHDKMYTLTKKITFRKDQAKIRDKVISEARKTLNDHISKVKALNNSKPWIKESEKEDLIQLIKKTSSWLDEKADKLKKQKKNEDPIIKTETIEAKVALVKESFAKLKATPKPKSEKEKSKNKTKTSKGSASENSEEQLFELFMKHKNITISGVDDSFKEMLKNSMSEEFKTWKADFMKNFTDAINQKKEGNEAGSDSQPSDTVI